MGWGDAAMKSSAVWLGLALAPLAMGQEDRVSDQEVIVADTILPAFYEIAPTYLEASMRAAVERECAARAKGKPSAFDEKETKSAAKWLCSGGPIYFVRGVLQSGDEEEHGFVCEGETDAKYYSRDSFDFNEESEPKCLSVSYDAEKKTHTLR
jgi:hypothetical protein